MGAVQVSVQRLRPFIGSRECCRFVQRRTPLSNDVKIMSLAANKFHYERFSFRRALFYGFSVLCVCACECDREKSNHMRRNIAMEPSKFYLRCVLISIYFFAVLARLIGNRWISPRRVWGTFTV